MALLILAVVFAIVPFGRAELPEKMPLLLGTLLAVLVGEWIAADVGKRRRKRRLAQSH